MSTPVRIAKGTGLTLCTVATNMLGQIVTVPIFLSHWDAETYGVWLIMIGALGYLFLLSVAFQQYAYGEMLKVGTTTGEVVRTIYRTSLVMSFTVAAIDLTIVLTLTSTMFMTWIAPNLHDTPHFSTVTSLLRIYSLLNFLIMPVNAMTASANTVHGHYTRVAAWALVNAVLRLGAPAIAVLMGADFWIAALVFMLAHVSSVLAALTDMLLVAKREGLLYSAPIAWRQGLRNVLFSLPLAAQALIDSFRQQGFRLVLGAFAGPLAVTALATTRTFANVLHQGLTTITAPVLPELMRYIIVRDQARAEGAFAIVWLSLFAILVPGVLALCLLAEPIFVYWTRGVVAFDEVLFLSLLLAVLVFAAGQPAAAVLQGQNRVGWLVGAALVAAGGLGALSLLLIPYFGLRGAGFALLGSELCSLGVTMLGAQRALQRGDMNFPRASFVLVIANVAAVGTLTFPAVTIFADMPIYFVVPLVTNVAFAIFYWSTLPVMVRARVNDALQALWVRVPSLRRAPRSK